MTRQRAVIVGAGAVADLHADALTRAGVELAAIVDASIDRAASFASRWGTTAASSLERVLSVTTPDAVHICTPTHTHLPLALSAVRAGCAVLLEKPPGLTPAEVSELDIASAAAGVPVAVVFQQRFGSGAVAARELAASGELGRPLVGTVTTAWYRDDAYFSAPFRGTWELAGGGPTMNLGIHQMDLALSILGPWSEVSAFMARLSRTTETEDVSVAVVRLSSGALLSVMNSAVSVHQESALRMDFEHASIELEHLYEYSDEDWRFTPADGHEELLQRWKAGLTGVDSSHAEQVRRFYASLTGGMTPPVTLADSLESVSLVAGIYESARMRSVVSRADRPTSC